MTTTNRLISLLLRVYKLNILILHPLHKEIEATLKELLGEDFNKPNYK